MAIHSIGLGMKNTFKFCCYAMLLLLSQISFAQLDIADEPLFLQSEVEPNVLFVIDDSGSMFLEIGMSLDNGDL